MGTIIGAIVGALAVGITTYKFDGRRRNWAVADDKVRWERERDERRRDERLRVCSRLLGAGSDFADAADWAHAVALGGESESTVAEYGFRAISAQQRLSQALGEVELVAPRELAEGATQYACALLKLRSEEGSAAAVPYEQRSAAGSAARKELLWLARKDIGTPGRRGLD